MVICLITTVTTTVTTVTTVAGIGGTLGAIGSLLLIFLLSGKEIADAGKDRLSKVLGHNLNIAIIPLLVTFSIIVTINVIQVL